MHLRIVPPLIVASLLALGWPLPGYPVIQEQLAPRVIEMKTPIYPAIARQAHASGTVVLEAEVASAGTVTAARLISGHPLLYRASRQAVMDWRFEPAPETDANRSVQLTFDFVIETTRCNQVSTITPYHLRITPEPPPDTENRIPANLEGTLCRVHGALLLRDKLEIRYGLVLFPAGYEGAEKLRFPNANTAALGGCLIEKEICDGAEIQVSSKYAEVLYCPKCRKAQAKWAKGHRITPAVSGYVTTQ